MPSFCAQCGAALATGARFCEECGATLGGGASRPTSAPTHSQKRIGWLWMMVGGVVVLLIVGGTLFALRVTPDSLKETLNSTLQNTGIGSLSDAETIRLIKQTDGYPKLLYSQLPELYEAHSPYARYSALATECPRLIRDGYLVQTSASSILTTYTPTQKGIQVVHECVLTSGSTP